MTFFQLHETKSDTSWNFWLKIWQVVVVFTQNQTRFKTCNSDYHTLCLFSHKIWHVLNFLVQSLTGCGNPKSKLDTVKVSNQNLTRRVLFSFKAWQFVYFVSQELTRCNHPNSESGTWWDFQVKNWHVVKFSFQNLTRCKFFNLESDKLRFFPWKIRHDVNCFFSKEFLWKITKRAKHVDFAEQNDPREIWIQPFPEFDTFCNFQLKTWLSLNFMKHLTLCKVFDSKLDRWWTFLLKTRHVVKLVIQNISRCDFFHTKLKTF